MDPNQFMTLFFGCVLVLWGIHKLLDLFHESYSAERNAGEVAEIGGDRDG